MAQNMKLDIFTWNIRRRYSRDTEERFIFRNVYESLFAENEEFNRDIAYDKFVERYIQSFNDRFYVNDRQTNGFVLFNEDVRLNRGRNVISGFLRGGMTGVEQTIRDRRRTNAAPLSVVSPREIATIPFYFLIWTPMRSNLGVMILQSNSDSSVRSLFQQNFKQFWSQYGVTLDYQKYVPSNYIEEIKDSGTVSSMVFKRQGLRQDSRVNLNPLYRDIENLKIELKISGFRGALTLQNIVDYISGNQDQTGFIGAALDELEMERGYQTEVEFKFRDKQVKGKLSTDFTDMLPSIDLNSELGLANNADNPPFNDINDYCLELLTTLQQEIEFR
jgi:hypothetical protein